MAANLAQPVPPRVPLPPVTAVVPVRDRSVARVLAALDVAEVIVVDDASANGEAIRAEAEAAGARYVRRAERGGAAAARNDGLAAASHDLVACVDSDCVPQPGWLEALLPHFADPELDAVAPRIVALEAERAREGRARRGARAAARGERSAAGRRRGGAAAGARRGERGARRGPARVAVARYEAARSPLDRGPAAARVIPYGRVPFVPGAALIVRSHLRFDETMTRRGGRGVRLARSVRALRARGGRSRTITARSPRAWLARRAYYGRNAADIAQRHPGKARPLNVSPWTTAAWAAVATRRPFTALAITATATALLARDLRDHDVPASTAIELAGSAPCAPAESVADALTRAWWPLSAVGRAHHPEGETAARGGAADQVAAPGRRRPGVRLRPLARLHRAARPRRAAPRAPLAPASRRALVDTLAPWEDAARGGW